jgi:hypothetical protein
LFHGSLEGTVHIQFRFHNSETTWDEYFVPATLHGYPCLGNNLQEITDNKTRARQRADEFIQALKPFATVWEVVYSSSREVKNEV